MLHKKLISILYCINDNAWPLVQTEQALYEIKVGGVKKAVREIDFSNYEIVCHSKTGLRIKQLWTDDQTVYMHLEDDSMISIGSLGIDSNGNTYTDILLSEDAALDFQEFEHDPDMKKITVG